MSFRTTLRSAFAFIVMLFLSATAQAGLFRSYISSAGNDANPCTLPAPCRLLPAALATVNDGGEIWLLDSANYNTGPVNITKSVTILAVPGVVGSVLAFGGDAIEIATASVKVALRNLVIVPFPGGGGTNGIVMTNGAGLVIENCLIANLPGTGISVNTTADVRVTDTTIRDSGGYGLYLQDGAHATVTRATISGNGNNGISVTGTVVSTTTADIADTTVDANFNGVEALSVNAGAVVQVSVRDSRIVRNGNYGVTARSTLGASVTLSVSSNIISNNGIGIRTGSSGSKVWASGNTVSDNAIGLDNSTIGLIESAGNNAVRNNGTNTVGTITPVAMM